MAVTKVIGLETEYGIICNTTADSSSGVSVTSASSLLIAAYMRLVKQGHTAMHDLTLNFDSDFPVDNEMAVKEQVFGSAVSNSVKWDFSHETPDLDVRAANESESSAANVDTQMLNVVLTNGARYYVDHAHPEISTPECIDARMAVLYDRAAELIAIKSMEAVKELTDDSVEIVVYKNNSDGNGNSYGCHENYLVDRTTSFSSIVCYATTHFVTRQIFTGAGKVGAESSGFRLDFDGFQLCQRADFIEEEIGLETTLRRPIINTRDEPHADPRKYRRLHVILGDANLSQVANFLKLGTTALVLAMIEDNMINFELEFASPVEALHTVSRDLTLQQPLLLADGRTITALAVQWDLLAAARTYVEYYEADAVGGEVAYDVLDCWESVLTGLESDPMQLARQVDWVAKLRLLEGYRERHNLSWNDPRLRMLDIQYHDLRPDRSLAQRLGLETLIDDVDAVKAMRDPPFDTRAFFRGRCLQHFMSDVVAANWDSVVFNVGSGLLHRVAMMEPSQGTSAHVGDLFDECQSAAELLSRLDSVVS
ncbi:MAG: depupylase/deamidase Dop [Acidimicrobiaceae bacterium]|nr:depupylase/deamidase Dop [Acidimicrobiaceae bacterium]